MRSEYLFYKQMSQLSGSGGTIQWKELSSSGQAVNHNPDGIKALGRWKVGDIVHGDKGSGAHQD